MNKVKSEQLSHLKQNIIKDKKISIKKILNVIVKYGWFLPVTPGSKMITVGGMVASDVHGKNHHKDGNFSNFVLGLKLFNNKKNWHVPCLVT